MGEARAERRRCIVERGLVVLSMVFLLSTVGLGSTWALVETDHLAVFSQDKDMVSSVAPLAEEVFTEVMDYWLPFPFEIQTEPETEIVAPGVVGELREEYGLSTLKAKDAAVFLYSDSERFWDDTAAYGAMGLATAGGIRLEGYPRRRMEEEIGEALRANNMNPLMGIVVCLCQGGGCPAVLAHEFTHLVQFTVHSVPLDQWFPDGKLASLLVEGMARWAEYKLVYVNPQAFEFSVRKPVAYWLSVGGELGHIPYGLRYEVGASIVGYLARRLSPGEIMALISPELERELGLPVGDGFSEAFRAIHGEPWEDFVADWRRHEGELGPTPSGERLYELYVRNVWLRASFLWPLLSPLERERLSARALQATVNTRGLDWAEGILRGAWKPPSPEVLEAIRRRLEPLRRVAREISGTEAELAVMSLSLKWATGGCDPAECIREYVELVNRYLVSPEVRKPSGT